MGEISVYYLAEMGYTVFAGTYLAESGKRIVEDMTRMGYSPEAVKRVVPVRLDVTDVESLKKAADEVREQIKTRKEPVGLVSMVACAGTHSIHL